MISAEFIVNTGQYQHVAVTVSGSSPADFERQLDEFSDKLKAKLGQFEAELESWTAEMYQRLVNGRTDEAAELLKSTLGTTVVSTVINEPKPVETAKEPNKWGPSPTNVQTPPWQNNNSGDDW